MMTPRDNVIAAYEHGSATEQIYVASVLSNFKQSEAFEVLRALMEIHVDQRLRMPAGNISAERILGRLEGSRAWLSSMEAAIANGETAVSNREISDDAKAVSGWSPRDVTGPEGVV